VGGGWEGGQRRINVTSSRGGQRLCGYGADSPLQHIEELRGMRRCIVEVSIHKQCLPNSFFLVSRLALSSSATAWSWRR
jgi:hypothetical protein